MRCAPNSVQTAAQAQNVQHPQVRINLTDFKILLFSQATQLTFPQRIKTVISGSPEKMGFEKKKKKFDLS